jgi:hypothetical protein
MNAPPALLRGIIQGKTILLESDSGLPDGSPVSIAVQTLVKAPADLSGLERSFGACADESEDLDKFLEWNRQQRKLSRQKDIE